MANLYEILAHAQNGEAIDRLAHQFGLTPQQAEDAVAALLPAISRGLKQSTATPDGLGGLLAMMAQQQDLYDDADAAFGATGRDAGNGALGAVFGSKDVSRAVAAQAQQATGIGSAILRKMLPVVIGLIISGLLKNLGGGAQGRPAPMPMPQPGPGRAPGGGSGGGGLPGGGLGDILGEVLRRRGGGPQSPSGGGPAPGGDLGQILRDMLGGGAAPSARGGPPSPGLKELSDLSKQLSLSGGYGESLFGEMFEPGHDVDRGHEESIAQLFDQFFGGRR